MAANEQLAMLIQPDRVHRTVYSDPAIFDLEMERIFGRAWLVLGHESQVAAPGDYFTTRIGREPVIVARDADDEDTIHVLYNRCRHRGAGGDRGAEATEHGRKDGAPGRSHCCCLSRE